MFLHEADPRFEVGSWKFRDFPDEHGDDWSCISPYVELGPPNAPLQNNLAFYLMGTKAGPTRARLTLNINAPAEAKTGLTELVGAARTLSLAALRVDLPTETEMAIRKARGASFTVAERSVAIERQDFGRDGIKGGFTLRYMVSLK